MLISERTLGEDIYRSGLIDPAVASAQLFDMMGNHDNHPMFAAYHMEKTGWYTSSNLRNLVGIEILFHKNSILSHMEPLRIQQQTGSTY